MTFSDPALKALELLATLIITSLLDIGAVNFFGQAKKPRPHNRILLINEFLARQQLAYPVWYISIMLVANLHSLSEHEAVIVSGWMALAALFSLFFWLAGLNGISGQDDVITNDHEVCDGTACSKLSIWAALEIVMLNIVLATASLVTAVIFVLQPAVVHSLAKTS